MRGKPLLPLFDVFAEGCVSRCPDGSEPQFVHVRHGHTIQAGMAEAGDGRSPAFVEILGHDAVDLGIIEQLVNDIVGQQHVPPYESRFAGRTTDHVHEERGECRVPTQHCHCRSHKPVDFQVQSSARVCC